MTAIIEAERRGEVLVIRLRGSIGYDDSDFEMSNDLAARVRAEMQTGLTHLLLDYSKASFVFPSSVELGVRPLLLRDVVGHIRIAACFEGNEKTRNRFRLTHLDRITDCFDTEDEAIAFLLSRAPMINAVRTDDEAR